MNRHSLSFTSGLSTCGSILRYTVVLVAMLGAVFAAHAQEDEPLEPERTVALDHGIVVTVPAGWITKDTEDTRKGDKGRLLNYFVCKTPECRQSQETCSFILRAASVEGIDDADRLHGLYADPMDRYQRMRSTLISTSDDAVFRKQLGLEKIGANDWYVVETDARHNMKSGLFAETVIDGWHLVVNCKTCETGEIRHQQARRILESVRRE